MSCLGAHYAITAQEAKSLQLCPLEKDRLELVFEIEEKYERSAPEYVAWSDKVWDGIHRALTDGRFEFHNGEYPFSHAVMGGECLCSRGWIVVLKSLEEVRDVSRALDGLDEREFKTRYWRIPQRGCEWDLTDEDCDYTWAFFQDVRELFRRAAADGRHVLFTASQ